MSRLRVALLALACGVLFAGCGIGNDSVPRDINPASLEPLSPEP